MKDGIVKASLEAADVGEMGPETAFDESQQELAELQQESSAAVAALESLLSIQRDYLQLGDKPSTEQLIEIESRLIPALTGSPGLESIAPVLQSQMSSDRYQTGLETIGDLIGNAIDSVADMIARVMAAIVRFFERLSPHLQMTRMSVYRLRQQLNGLAGSVPATAETALGAWAGLVSTESNAPKNGADVMRNTRELLAQCDIVTGPMNTRMSRMYDEISAFLSAGPAVIGQEDVWADKLCAIIDRGAPYQLSNVFHGLSRVNDPRWPEGDAVATPALPGQRSLVFVKPQAVQSPSERLRSYNKAVATLTRLQPGSSRSFTGQKMRTMNFQELHVCVGDVERMLAVLESQISGGARGQLRKMEQALKRSQNRFRQRATIGGGVREYDARALALISSVILWYQNPYLAMVSHLTSSISGHSSLLRANMANFNKAD